MRLTAYLCLIAVCGSGCALLAKKTPTPAAKLSPEYLASLPAPPNERYYLILFGSQDWTRRPAYTHTWATLVRATETPGCSETALEVHTISWLPAKLDIDGLSRKVEPGHNFTLEETIRNSLRTNQSIAMWGPYEVWHGFAVQFLTQKAFLESGAVGYQCIDTFGEAGREGNGCDCIHAISDMDPEFPRWRYPLAFYGKPGTSDLLRRLMHGHIMTDGADVQDWIIPRIGLNQYPIEQRRYIGRVKPYVPGSAGLNDGPLPGPNR